MEYQLKTIDNIKLNNKIELHDKIKLHNKVEPRNKIKLNNKMELHFINKFKYWVAVFASILIGLSANYLFNDFLYLIGLGLTNVDKFMLIFSLIGLFLIGFTKYKMIICNQFTYDNVWLTFVGVVVFTMPFTVFEIAEPFSISNKELVKQIKHDRMLKQKSNSTMLQK